MDVRNAVPLVTGANRGLGREIVRSLLRAGVPKVYAGVRDPARLDAAAFDPRRVVPLKLDVTCGPAVAGAAALAADVTLLVNNAGILQFGGALAVSDQAFARAFATNVLGPLAMVRAFAPVVERNGGGAVVNILSLLSLVNAQFVASYCASKAAAWAMTQSLRAELPARGIQVVAVFPGGIDTDMLRGVDTSKADAGQVAQAIVGGVAAGLDDIYPDPASRYYRATSM